MNEESTTPQSGESAAFREAPKERTSRDSGESLETDSSYALRKELADEPGCPGEVMGDSARMNMRLHKTMLARIAANGGNVPQDLLE